MALTELEAWTIFRNVSLGEPEGEQAEVRMTDEEDFCDYEVFRDNFDLQLGQIGIAANNEAAAAFEDFDPELAIKPRIEWTVADYRKMLDRIDGTTYERLHLTAFFNVQNNVLLLDLIKPA